MAAKNIKLIKEGAYKRVFSVSKKDLSLPEHIDVMENALRRVWEYPKCYPQESEELMDARHDMECPSDEEYNRLATHFKEIYPDDFKKMLGYEIIFAMYQRLLELEGSGEVIKDNHNEDRMKEPESSNDTDKGDSDISNKTNNKEKENAFMTTKTRGKVNELEGLAESIANGMSPDTEKTLDAIDKLSKDSISALGEDITTGNEDKSTAEPKTSTITASQEQIRKNEKERMENSKLMRIEKFVVAAPKAKERLTVNVDEGAQAMGIVSNPQKALATFVSKFGVKADGAGGYIYEKAGDGQNEAAAKLHAILLAAIDKPETQVEAHVGEAVPTLKGGYMFTGGTEKQLMTTKEIINILVTKTFGQVGTMDQNSKAGISYVMRNKNVKTSDANGARTNQKSQVKTPSVSLAIQNRKDLLENEGNVIYVKERDPNTKVVERGFKSEVCAKYKTDDLNSKNVKIERTYRIPLLVEQWKTEPKDPAIKAKFASSTKVGEVVMPDLNSEEGQKAQFVKLAQALAYLAETDTDSDESFKEIANMANGVKQEKANTQAESFAGV